MRILWSEIDNDFHIQRPAGWLSLYRRLFLKRLPLRRLDRTRCSHQDKLLILYWKLGFGIPEERAHPLTAVTHQEVDVVISLTYIKYALKVSIPLRVLLSRRYA